MISTGFPPSTLIVADRKKSRSTAIAHARCSAAVAPKKGGSSTSLHSLPGAINTGVPA
jgi:hypothetical protein